MSNAQASYRLLASDPPDVSEARSGLAGIVQDGKRAGEVIHRLRGMLEKGDAERIEVDVNEVIHDVVRLLDNGLREKAISLKLELSAELDRVTGNRVQLQQLVMNLMLNAAEAMSQDGQPRELCIRTQPGRPRGVNVEFRDSGVGLDPGHVDQIFEPFFTTKPRGLGMGLAICRTIVEAHGGRMEASDNPDSGATFTVSLPTKA